MELVLSSARGKRCEELSERVDLVVKVKYVVQSAENPIIEDGAIAISGDKIAGVGRADDVLRKFRGEEVVERRHSIALPGFVDCHTHTQQLFLRTFINDYYLQLPAIWTELLVPFERSLNSELAYLSSMLSVAAMVKSGTIYFVEAGAPYTDELVRAINEVGAKGAVTYPAYDVYKGAEIDSDEVIERLEELARKYSGSSRVRALFSLRQIMMASDSLIRGLIDLVEKYKVGLTMHLGEYQGEVDYSLTKYGLRPLATIDRLGLTKYRPFIIAHGIFLSFDEYRIVRDRNLHVCWCPTTDSLIIAPHWIPYRDPSVSFGIGSDGGAFSSLDLLLEVKIARSVGKAINNSLLYDKYSLTTRDLLRALTSYSDVVFGKRSGVLEENSAADLVVLDLKNVYTLPHLDPLEAVISFAEGSCVSDVIVDGEFVVRDRELVKVDEEELLNRVLDEQSTIDSIIKEVSRSLPKLA